MTEAKEFVRICPTCQSHNKVIKLCLKCNNICCSDCSIDRMCLECYITLKSREFISEYFYAKNKRTAVN